MDTLKEYLHTLKNEEHKTKLNEVVSWVDNNFPELKLKIAWNQPMFTHHETYIIGFSASSKHLAIAPEVVILNTYLDKIEAAGYTYGKHIFRIAWKDEVNYELLTEIINYTIEFKKDCTTFWLK